MCWTYHSTLSRAEGQNWLTGLKTTTFNTFLVPMLKLSVPPSSFKAKNWPSWPMSVSTGPISPSISLDGLEHAIEAGLITY